MRQWWKVEEEEWEKDLELFNPNKHAKPVAGKFFIENCRITKYREIHHIRHKDIVFRNVLFEERFLSINTDGRNRLTFDKCVFSVNVTLDFFKVTEVSFTNCKHLGGTTEFWAFEIEKLNIHQCTFLICNFQIGNCDTLAISNCYFNQLAFFPISNNRPGINLDNRIKNFKSNFYIVDSASFFKGIKYDTAQIVIEDFIDHEHNTLSPGDLNVLGGGFENGLQVISRRTDFLVRPEVEQNPLIGKVYLLFGQLDTININISRCNLNELVISGRNTAVSVYLISCIFREIRFANYEQSKSGLINFRGISNLKGVLNSSDTLILNQNLFFQNSDLSYWKAKISGSQLSYQALSTKMPQEIQGHLTTEQNLDVLNTWLENSSKDSNIINWSKIKRNQLELIWKLKQDNGGLNRGQRTQWFVQRLNDYGTDWTKPAMILFFLNLIPALGAIAVCHCLYSVPAAFGDLIDVFFNLLNPISKLPPEKYWVGVMRLIPYTLKVFNAVLIVQMVAAFRVYFKR